MDGASGPGVGSARSVVQAGGVGMIMFGVADKALVGSPVDGAQAVIYMESIMERHLRRTQVQAGKKKERDFCIAVSICSVMHTHLIAS